MSKLPKFLELTPPSTTKFAGDPDFGLGVPVHTWDASCKKATVVGLYGISGCGKSYLLNQLKRELGDEHYAFWEGSEAIASCLAGGLKDFEKLKEDQQAYYRQLAVDKIAQHAADHNKTAVVAGHFMLWTEGNKSGKVIFTPRDRDTYTHIVYLHLPAEIIKQRRWVDLARRRQNASVEHLRKWQEGEQDQLRRLCLKHGILFSGVSGKAPVLQRVTTILRDFRLHSEEYNQCLALKSLDIPFSNLSKQLRTVLVMDADKTLASVDTGALFWKKVCGSNRSTHNRLSLNTIFGTMGYSYTAFRQAMLLYQEEADHLDFDAICQAIASEVVMYPEFVSLLQVVAEQGCAGAVIVTCGLTRVWEKVLEREGLSKAVKVIGGELLTDAFVVTPAVKAGVVNRLQETYPVAKVCAFGDSPLDLNMLIAADEAVIVVGDEHTRSKSMESAVKDAIKNDLFQPWQAILSSGASPILEGSSKAPVTKLIDPGFIDKIFRSHQHYTNIQPIHATERSATRLLMTPMRNATVAGPSLKRAHRHVGWYLGAEFLTGIIGTEKCPIRHVQGHQTNGYRLFYEKQTSIVALMRGGEAMAHGVHEIFPLANILHANHPKDIGLECLEGQLNLVLVDSVINDGKTMVEFVRHVRGLHATIRIVMVAGVVQKQSLERGAELAEALAGYSNIKVVALRLSDNKFTGTGAIDTGNRLCNTTHLA